MKGNVCGILVGKLEKIDDVEDLERWKYNIKIGLRKIGWETWTELIWLNEGTAFRHRNEHLG
jgi:hypothetical protein